MAASELATRLLGPREQGPAAVQFYSETKTVYVKY